MKQRASVKHDIRGAAEGAAVVLVLAGALALAAAVSLTLGVREPVAAPPPAYQVAEGI